jgi:sirohydrochlorin ferrochelatase
MKSKKGPDSDWRIILSIGVIGMRYMGKKGLLLIGHGSRLPYNKELVEETARQMVTMSDYVIRCAYMEKSTPTITEALAEFRKEDLDLLVAVPLFLAKGVHILEDIPILLNLENGTSRGTFSLANGRAIPLVYAEPIGKDPLLAKLMLKNAESAIRKNL